MELIRGLHNIGKQHYGCVLSIGKFDGVHLGHQAVLANLIEKANSLKLPAVVMVFEPQPEELFSPQHAPARLSLLRDKYIALKKVGIHRLLCVRFTPAFSAMTPEAFIQKLLLDKLGVKFLVVGDDFKFGHRRSGGFTMLLEHSKKNDFDVVSTQSFTMHDCRISSTEVRKALANADFAQVTAMLGAPFVLRGKVVHGEKNGRTIGYPTANVLLHRHKSPLKGVFAVTVNSSFGRHLGVANVGMRPTLNGHRMQLEVHIFDFKMDLYGQNIEVEFVEKIRDEIKFANFQALKLQIVQDAQKAKDILAIDLAK